jgi:hypothetical protein
MEKEREREFSLARFSEKRASKRDTYTEGEKQTF